MVTPLFITMMRKTSHYYKENKIWSSIYVYQIMVRLKFSFIYIYFL